MPYMTSQRAEFRILSVSAHPAEGRKDFFSDKKLMIVMMVILVAAGPFNLKLDVKSGKKRKERKNWLVGPEGGGCLSISKLTKHIAG